MNQPISQCEHNSRNSNRSHNTFTFLLLSLVLFVAPFSRGVAASPDTTNAIAGQESADLLHTRQATLTVANSTTIHTYTSPFAGSDNSAVLEIPTGTDRQTASHNTLLWIFDIALDLHTDYDHDGHYSNFSLTLDLDTTLSAATVYAVLYLASDGGPWNEYAVTGNFTVSGRGSADTFSLQAELDSGYPSGYYNHYIEVYDAYTHELIGAYGPDDSYQLYGLPIESRIHDGEFSFGTDISLSFTGTGSMSPGLFAFLAGVFFIRRRLHKRRVVQSITGTPPTRVSRQRSASNKTTE